MHKATEGVLQRLDERIEDNEWGEESMTRAYHRWVLNHWGGCDARAALWVAAHTFDRQIERQ